ncbi:hypothetical protein FEM48_Zijuj07G0040700 [Ziziphus jujuba var. spinosa]|uniref:Amino acid transporter transmembrane domain-containing protein n=1 Tax=Ziziphus jujuba var. spinosa TaxID=714518 RepID=A0A978V2C3_ZIZJJ|nr:hypothetical protein FEM48_Zijuj07G0040700 [Ziziphus jujuba var. spinosa]
MENVNQNQPQPQQPQNPDGESTITIKTCFNVVNALFGVGILSVPYALSRGGWLCLILLLLVALISCYTGLLLKRCIDTNPLIKTYPNVGNAAFGPRERNFVAAIIYLELFAVAVEFFILEGDTLEMLFRNTNFRIGSLNLRGKECFILLTALIILPSTWLRNLDILAYLSVGGVLASIILVECVLWIGAVNDVGFHERGLLLDLGGFPIAASMFVFCYCGHAVFPTVCMSMGDRRKFPKVLFICFVTSTITYGSMAVTGYVMYGEFLNSQVTLNLLLGKNTAIKDKFIPSNNRSISILIRTLLVTSTVVVALPIPFFRYLMTLIGAFSSIAVAFLLPCLCHLKINNIAWGFGFEFVAIIEILVNGFLIGMAGTYVSIKQIVSHLSNPRCV